MILWAFLPFIAPVPTYTQSVDKQTIIIGGNGEILQTDLKSKFVISQITTLSIQSGITKIGANAFEKFSALIQVDIPSSCVEIGSNAFSDCTSLVSISFPDGIETLSRKIFTGCTKLKSILFPSTLTSFDGDSMFEGCSSLSSVSFNKDGGLYFATEDKRIIVFNKTIAICGIGNNQGIKIPSFITELGNGFMDGQSITSIDFTESSSLKKIGDRAFRLTWVSACIFPEGLEAIGASLYQGTASIYNVYLPSTLISVGNIFEGEVPSIVTLGSNCRAIYVDERGLMFTSDLKILVFIPINATEVEIPGNVTTISPCILLKVERLEKINISTTNEMFASDNNILYEKGFKNCICGLISLELAKINSLCETINKEAFKRTKIKTLDLRGTNLNRINFLAFGDCKDLTKILFGEKLKQIDSYAFQGTPLNSFDLVLPYSLTTLSSYCFYGINTKKVDMSACTQLKTISSGAFQNSLIESIIFPDSLTTISSDCFKSSSLINITFPSKLTLIGSSALADCRKLRYVVWKNIETTGPLSIESLAFSGSSLIEIHIPDRATTIRQEAFKSCTSLERVTFSENSKLSLIEGLAFSECINLQTLYFGNYLETILPTGLSRTSGLISIEVSKQNSHFSSKDGVLYSNDGRELVSFPGGIDKFTISGSVEKITDSAFYGCKKLKLLSFDPDVNLKEIGANTFYGCEALLALEFPIATQFISENAFYGCISLKNITFISGSLLKTIGLGSFSGCKELTTLLFEEPSNLETISSNAFKDCRELQSFTFPSSIKTIGDSSFSNCDKLESVVFGPLTESIGSSAFSGCYSITSIKLPSNITSIGSNAFAGCNLQYIIYCGHQIFTTRPFDITDISVYVKFDYESDNFCGLKSIKALGSNCLFPTKRFTVQAASKHSNMGSLFILFERDGTDGGIN